jgi:hypothetical protein
LAKNDPDPSVLASYAIALRPLRDALPKPWKDIAKLAVADAARSEAFAGLAQLWKGRGGPDGPSMPWGDEQTREAVGLGQQAIETYTGAFAHRLQERLRAEGIDAALTWGPAPKLAAFWPGGAAAPGEGGYHREPTEANPSGPLIYERSSSGNFRNPMSGASWLVHEAQHHVQFELNSWSKQLGDACPAWLSDAQAILGFREMGPIGPATERSPSTYAARRAARWPGPATHFSPPRWTHSKPATCPWAPS